MIKHKQTTEASKEMNSKQDSSGNLAGNSNRIEGVRGGIEAAGVGGGDPDKLYNKFSNFTL